MKLHSIPVVHGTRRGRRHTCVRRRPLISGSPQYGLTALIEQMGFLMGKRSDGEKRLCSWTGIDSAWQTGIWNSILYNNTPLLAEPDGVPGGQGPAVWCWDFITRASREDVLGGAVMRASQQVQSSWMQIYRLTWHLNAFVGLLLRTQDLLARSYLSLGERLA